MGMQIDPKDDAVLRALLQPFGRPSFRILCRDIILIKRRSARRHTQRAQEKKACTTATRSAGTRSQAQADLRGRRASSVQELPVWIPDSGRPRSCKTIIWNHVRERRLRTSNVQRPGSYEPGIRLPGQARSHPRGHGVRANLRFSLSNGLCRRRISTQTQAQAARCHRRWHTSRVPKRSSRFQVPRRFRICRTGTWL